jgi:hypothetical protein
MAQSNFSEALLECFSLGAGEQQRYASTPVAGKTRHEEINQNRLRPCDVVALPLYDPFLCVHILDSYIHAEVWVRRIGTTTVLCHNFSASPSNHAMDYGPNRFLYGKCFQE